jgi:catechol 2,3-dioxygenase-like lactoylglutathione lyase family enzyme
MKRFHLHLRVTNMTESVAFYSKLFAADPTTLEHDYAKWMLEDPRVNFAISALGDYQNEIGIHHIGFQADTADELVTMKAAVIAANLTIQDVGTTNCCYARSTKYWMKDPQGIAWQQFYTFKTVPTFSTLRTSLNFR